VEDDEVSQELRDPHCVQSRPSNILPSRMTPKDFLTVLENSIAQDKAEEVVNPVSKLGAKVFFQRLPVENLSGMDDHIMKLQSGLKNLDTESCSDGARFEMRDTVNNDTTFSLTSSIFEDMFKQPHVGCSLRSRECSGLGTKSTIKEDLALVDPSVDPSHYTTQVQVVSDKVLKSIQAAMQEVLVADIFSKANGAMTPTDDAQLRWELVTGSKHILRSITDCIMLILHSGDENIRALNKQSLQNLRRCLIMYKLHLRDLCVFSDVSSWEIQPSRCRGFTVRVPTTS
ncbi:hypothetical protein NFI96_018765, partial [Prochilodus magdalenae]